MDWIIPIISSFTFGYWLLNIQIVNSLVTDYKMEIQAVSIQFFGYYTKRDI